MYIKWQKEKWPEVAKLRDCSYDRNGRKLEEVIG